MTTKQTIKYLEKFIPKDLMVWVKKQIEETEKYNKKIRTNLQTKLK